MSRPVPDAVILGLLKAQPAHGYDLLERFRDPAHLGRVWSLSTSQLYAVLKRLEAEGTIQGRTVSVPNAPERVEYSITETGEEHLNAWLHDPHPPLSIHRIRVIFLSRLYIASILGIPTDDIIARQIAVCEEQRRRLLAEHQQPASSMEELTLDFVLGQLTAALDWLARCHDFNFQNPAGIPAEK